MLAVIQSHSNSYNILLASVMHGVSVSLLVRDMQDGFKGDDYAAENGQLYKIAHPVSSTPYFVYC